MSILQTISQPKSIFSITKEQLKFFEDLGVGRTKVVEDEVSIHLSQKDKILVIDHLTVGEGGEDSLSKIKFSRLN